MSVRIKSGLAALAFAAAAAAQPLGDGLDPGDVLLLEDAMKIQIGAVDQNGMEDLGVRVFPATFPSPGDPVFTDDPGFDTRLDALTPFSVVRLNMRDALRMWSDSDMDGSPDFGALATLGDGGAQLQLELFFGANSFFSPTTPDTIVTGPNFAVSEEGDIHVHPFHSIAGGVEPGLFLMEFEIESNVGGVEKSDPFFYVYALFGETSDGDMIDQQDQTEAIQWVQDNLIDAPSPADLNGDGKVDGADLGQLLLAWDPIGPVNSPADLNGDNKVDGADLGQLLLAWSP